MSLGQILIKLEHHRCLSWAKVDPDTKGSFDHMI